MDKIGIVIINYKDYAERFLLDCRDSLRQQNCGNFHYQVYLVDNASTELSRNFLTKNYPEAKILARIDGNYCAGNNLGAKTAIHDGCNYIVFVNMDTEMDKDWLKYLFLASKNESFGIIQSKILLFNQKDKINSIGNIIHYLGFGFTDGYKNININKNTNLIELKGYTSGCSQIISKNVFDKIGYLDENYYMYHDDLEYSWRAKLAGYKIGLAEKSIVYHKYEFKRSVQMLQYMERNRYLAILHYYKLPTILVLLPIFIVMDMAMIFYSIMGKWFKKKLNVYLYFFKISTWQEILKKRTAVKSIRRIKDKNIIKNFSGTIKFTEIENPVLKYLGNPLLNVYFIIIKKIIFW